MKIVSVGACKMRRIALNIAQKRLAAALRADPLRQLTALSRPPSRINGERRRGKGDGRKGVKRKGT